MWELPPLAYRPCEQGHGPCLVWHRKLFLKNVIFPEAMEKASKKIEKKCYSSRKEFRK